MTVNWSSVQITPDTRGEIDWAQVVRRVLSGLVVQPMSGVSEPPVAEWNEHDVRGILSLAGADMDGRFPGLSAQTIKAQLEAAIARTFVGFNLP